MPRQPKRGLDYFGKDVDFYEDFKIIDLLSEHGPVGVVIYDFLLTQIYKNGYYLELPIDKAALLAVRAVGSRWLKKDQAINVIHYCGDIGLFRVDLLDAGIFTSAGIQKRYAEVTSKRVINRKEYWVLDAENQEMKEKCAEPVLNAPFFRVSEEETSVSGAETPVSDTEMQQKKKEKEKQEKKEKEKDIRARARLPSTVSMDELTERFGEVLAHVVYDWLTYKQERRETYKPTGLKSLLTRIEKELYAYGEQAVADVIQLSMSNGWRGIVWEKLQQKDERRNEQNAGCSSKQGEFNPFEGEEIL